MCDNSDKIAALETEIATLRARVDAIAPVLPAPALGAVLCDARRDGPGPILFTVKARPVGGDVALLPEQSLADPQSDHEWTAHVRASGAVEIFRDGRPSFDGVWQNGRLEAELPRSVLAALAQEIAREFAARSTP